MEIGDKVEIIFTEIESVIEELWNRAIKGNLNPAYQIAMETNIRMRIKDALEKIEKSKLAKKKAIFKREIKQLCKEHTKTLTALAK
jgi:hypothetical protein